MTTTIETHLSNLVRAVNNIGAQFITAVTGPGSSVNGNLASWSGTTGTVLADSGIPKANVIQSTTTLGGDLSGTLPNPTVAKINGVALGSTAATAGNVLVASGTQWVSVALSGDVSAVSAAGAVTLGKLNGVAYPASPGTNTVPVVTGANTVTYEAVPNAALANSTITLNAGAGVGLTAPGAVSLGATGTIGSTSDKVQLGALGLGVGAPATNGMIASTLGANSVTGLVVKRNTDAAPTGNFIQLQSAAAATLFNVDITGTLTAGSTGAGFTIALGSSIVTGQLALANIAQIGGGTVLGNSGTVPANVAATISPVLGIPATSTGTLGLANGGFGGATVTIQNNAAAAAYNFNLPSGAGTSGQPLLSGGGGAAAQTYGTLGVAAGGTGVTTSTGTGSVVLSAGPTLTGTVNGATSVWSGNVTAAAFIPSGAAVPTNGMYLQAANTVSFATNTTERLRLGANYNAFASSGVINAQTGANEVLSAPSFVTNDGTVQGLMGAYASGGLVLGSLSNHSVLIRSNNSVSITISAAGAIQFNRGYGVGAVTSDGFGNLTVTAGTVVTQTTGSWTPADNSGAAIPFSNVSASYTKIGNMVYAYCQFTYGPSGSAAAASISGLPFASANAAYALVPAIVDASVAFTVLIRPNQNATTAVFLNGASSGAALTNANLGGATVSFVLIYPAT